MKLYARSIVEQQHTQPTVQLPFPPSLPEHMGRDLQKQQPKIAASLRGRLRARVSNVPATMPAFQQHSNCSSLHVGEKFSFLIFIYLLTLQCFIIIPQQILPLDPGGVDSPAGQICGAAVKGSFKDPEAIRTLAKQTDML